MGNFPCKEHSRKNKRRRGVEALSQPQAKDNGPERVHDGGAEEAAERFVRERHLYLWSQKLCLFAPSSALFDVRAPHSMWSHSEQYQPPTNARAGITSCSRSCVESGGVFRCGGLHPLERFVDVSSGGDPFYIPHISSAKLAPVHTAPPASPLVRALGKCGVVLFVVSNGVGLSAA